MDWQRAAARRALLPIAIALIGAVGVLTTQGTLRIVAWVIIAVAMTVAVALVFLEVGYSEDRARNRDSGQHPPRRR